MGHKAMRKVLFLCTGNSCRSQMAEAIVNARLGDRWQAYSAGTRPAGYVNKNAIQALKEIGISHVGHCKHVDDVRHISFDVVVTVCDSASEECPVWLGTGKVLHHSFSDPAKASGSGEQVMGVFRQVRDEIAREIPELLAQQ